MLHNSSSYCAATSPPSCIASTSFALRRGGGLSKHAAIWITHAHGSGHGVPKATETVLVERCCLLRSYCFLRQSDEPHVQRTPGEICSSCCKVTDAMEGCLAGRRRQANPFMTVRWMAFARQHLLLYSLRCSHVIKIVLPMTRCGALQRLHWWSRCGRYRPQPFSFRSLHAPLQCPFARRAGVYWHGEEHQRPLGKRHVYSSATFEDHATCGSSADD